MTSPAFDAAPIAAAFDIPVAELMIVPIPDTFDGRAYEHVLMFDRRRAAPQSAVLTVPNYFGVRQANLEIAASTIGAEYAVLVADVFGQAHRPTTPDEAVALITPLKKDRAELRRRVAAALAALRAQRVRELGAVGACGFCFGGTAALELARSGAALPAFASLHGALDSPTPADAQQIRGAVLVLHGEQDPSVPREQVDAFIASMRATSVDWQLTSYGQAGHSFTDPGASRPGFFYHRPTAQRAAVALRRFFAETLA